MILLSLCKFWINRPFLYKNKIKTSGAEIKPLFKFRPRLRKAFVRMRSISGLSNLISSLFSGRRVPLFHTLRVCPQSATNEKIHPPASLRKGGFSKIESRHLPIFAGRLQPTIFGTTELNFCVRNGNRWNLCVIGTGQICFKPGLHIFSFNLRDAPSKLNITANSQMEYLKIVVKPSTY